MSAIIKVQRMFWYHRKLLKHLVEGEQQPVHQQVNRISYYPCIFVNKGL